MSKKKFLKIDLMALMFVFFLFIINGFVIADDSCDLEGIGSTSTGNYLISEGWRDSYKPNIYSSSDTVDRGDHVNVWVDSGGKACPTYYWSVSGTGFHFDNINGPTTATTDEDLQTLELWADNSACGAAEIKVTDCNNETKGYVRCTTGEWSSLGNVCVAPGPHDTVDIICFSRTEGRYKQDQCYGHSTHTGYTACGDLDCSSHCFESGCTSYGCNQCVTLDCSAMSENYVSCHGENSLCCSYYLSCSYASAGCKCTNYLHAYEWVCSP